MVGQEERDILFNLPSKKILKPLKWWNSRLKRLPDMTRTVTCQTAPIPLCFWPIVNAFLGYSYLGLADNA